MDNNNVVTIQTLQAELQEITTGLTNGTYKKSDYPRIWARIAKIETDLSQLQACYKTVSR